jgi:hypothetical protein
MIRTQVQFPDELYRRAKSFGEEQEMSLAEMTRRGLEMFLDRYPPTGNKESRPWKFPQIKGGVKVSPERLRDILDEERERHARRGISS